MILFIWYNQHMTQLKGSRLKPAQSKQLFQHFIAGSTARTAADLVGVHRNTAIRHFYKLREIIYRTLEDINETQYFYGEVEMDESSFGGMRKGKTGRGLSSSLYSRSGMSAAIGCRNGTKRVSWRQATACQHDSQ